MKHSIRGFSLIEMMVVVSISAILVAMWANQATARQVKEMNRAKTTAAFSMLSRPKIAVTEFFHYEGKFPVNNKEAQLPPPEVLAGIETEYIEVVNGAIHITLKKSGPESPEKILSFRPAVLKAEPFGPYMTWVCGNQEVDSRLIVSGVNHTNIDNQYLPRQCRGNGTSTGIETAAS